MVCLGFTFGENEIANPNSVPFGVLAWSHLAPISKTITRLLIVFAVTTHSRR
jgi:hypothetical protein